MYRYRWLVVTWCWGWHHCSHCDQPRWVQSHMGSSLLNHPHSVAKQAAPEASPVPTSSASRTNGFQKMQAYFIQAHSHSLTCCITPVTAVRVLSITNKNYQRRISIVKIFFTTQSTCKKSVSCLEKDFVLQAIM